MNNPLITSSQEWNEDLLEEVYGHIERIAHDKYGLDTYPNQLEVIAAEQMLDAYCITLNHKLLRNDLQWIKAKDIRAGETILGFDEYGPHRKFKNAKVLSVSYEEQPIYQVTLSSGKTFSVTREHKWLVREKRGSTSRLRWIETHELRGADSRHNASCIPQVLNTWEPRTEFDAGWVSGLFDGEGTTLKDTLQKLSISQSQGLVLDRLAMILEAHGVNFSIVDTEKPSVKTVSILGTVADKLEILGKYHPERLIERVNFDQLGMMKTPIYHEVVSIDPFGTDVIAKITTSTSTFICDGYPMHNCSIGLPIFYNHWTFGEQFIKQLEAYKRGYMGLAYEIVINSNPCIAYLMEESTMMMQALVTAHASFGHNHFFKNNYLFKQWTDAEGIIDYLVFAKKFIRECEERYGLDEVETLLDAAHALHNYGVDKYKKPRKLTEAETEQRRKDRDAYIQSQLNVIWRTIPQTKNQIGRDLEAEDRFPSEPQENILYFIEKNAPRLKEWQREIIRIVRKTAQYFYPQGQTKVMNEGCATFFHYKIMHDLYDEGIMDDGALLEFYQSHSNVVFQPDYDDRRFSQINPYALGWAMYKDIERIATNPTDEDREWFKNQEWVGSGDWLSAIKFAIANFKDESFIQQYLSPEVIRKFHLFDIRDDERESDLEVAGIHNKRGYKTVRNALAAQYNRGYVVPDIQVHKVDRWGDRSLTLRHSMVNRRPLEPENTTDVLKYLAALWGYDVKLESVDEHGTVRAVFDLKGDETLLDIFLDDDL